jgi:uracil-DNA glycosylase
MNFHIEFLDVSWSWKKNTLIEFLNKGNTPSCWEKLFFDNKEELEKISYILSSEKYEIYPSINNVFRAFYCTSLEKIKVVLLGMDPYHNGNAVGLCFSVSKKTNINPSLKNIFKELELEGYKVSDSGDISHWAKQGCLMLNTALTVQKSKPDSHTKYWCEFTEKTIKYISSQTENVAWVLMGSKAIHFEDIIDSTRGHKIFSTSHPSPFSAYKSFIRKEREIPAFLHSGIFKQINIFLSNSNRQEIIW